MCGRFAVTVSPSMLARHFELTESLELAPNYNIAPSRQIATIRLTDGKRQGSFMRWGLMPHWAKDEKIGYKLINARAETVFEKPAYRGAVKSRRCLIPASGFFEWQKAGDHKQPFFITLRDRQLFAFAGIWESWCQPGSERLESCAILTTAANRLIQPIHARMPVILAPEHYAAWLRPDAAPESLQGLLQPFAAYAMTAFPVSQAINNPANNRPDCITPLPTT